MSSAPKVEYRDLVSKSFFTVHEAVVEIGRETYVRHIVRHPGGAAVVAVMGNDAVCVEQYRPALGRMVLEIPGGRPEVGETGEQTAQRELYEETGLVASILEQLVDLAAVPCFSDWRAKIFLATRFESCLQPSVRGEIPTIVRLVPLRNVEQLIARGELLDSKTIVGLLLARAVLDGLLVKVRNVRPNASVRVCD